MTVAIDRDGIPHGSYSEVRVFAHGCRQISAIHPFKARDHEWRSWTEKIYGFMAWS